MQEQTETGAIEWLFTGNATAKVLDFLTTFKDFDYSEADIAEAAGVSPRTIYREIPKLESLGIITFTRNVGRAKLYKLNPNSEIVKHLENFAYLTASKKIDITLNQKSVIEQETTQMTKKMTITK